MLEGAERANTPGPGMLRPSEGGEGGGPGMCKGPGAGRASAQGSDGKTRVQSVDGKAAARRKQREPGRGTPLQTLF